MFNEGDVVKFRTGKVEYEVTAIGEDGRVHLLAGSGKVRVAEAEKLGLVQSSDPVAEHEIGDFGPVPAPPLLEESFDDLMTRVDEYRDGQSPSLEEMVRLTEQNYEQSEGAQLATEENTPSKPGDHRDSSYGRRILMALQSKPVFSGLINPLKARDTRLGKKTRKATKNARRAQRKAGK